MKLDTYKSVIIASSNVVVSYSDNEFEFELVACNFLTTSHLEFLLAAYTKLGLPNMQPTRKVSAALSHLNISINIVEQM